MDALVARNYGRLRPVKRSTLAVIAATILLSILYRYTARTWGKIAELDDWRAGAFLAGSLIIAGALAWWCRHIRYGDLWLPLGVLVRGAGVVLFAQSLFDAFYPTAVISNLFIGTYADARVLIAAAVVAGACALKRPAFLVPLALSYVAFRHRAPNAYDFQVTALDFTTTSDVCLFGATCALLWMVAAKHWPHARFQATGDFLRVPRNFLRFQKALWGLSVGIHLGNYFRSGLAKMNVGGGDPFFWVTDNPTVQAIAIGLYRSNGPLAGWPGLLDHYANFLTTFAVSLNAGVFLLQILAPLSVVHRRALILFTLGFDLMHLGIYSSLGAFFFIWIGLNIVILLSLAKMSDGEFTMPLKLTALVAALFGYLSFQTAELGWLDGSKVVRQRFIAHTEDGAQVTVPPAFYSIFAYQMANAILYVPPGHFPVRHGGNVTNIALWEDARTCGPLAIAGDQAFMPVSSIEAMVRDFDDFFRRHPWAKDWIYWYSHHEPSNPALFAAFNRTHMGEIESYSYVVESSCISVENGRLKYDVRKRSEFSIGEKEPAR